VSTTITASSVSVSSAVAASVTRKSQLSSLTSSIIMLLSQNGSYRPAFINWLVIGICYISSECLTNDVSRESLWNQKVYISL